jgi:hypothetical protein
MPLVCEVSAQLSTEKGLSMAMLIGAVLIALLVVGPAALTGQPVLMLVGVVLAAAVLLIARRWPPRRLRDR